MLEVKSVLLKALVVACPRCEASVGEPCTRADGSVMEFKGHFGVHSTRMFAARHVKKDTA
jgi:hypothetical protein